MYKYHSVLDLQHYVIKFVSDLRQVGGFLLVLCDCMLTLFNAHVRLI